MGARADESNTSVRMSSPIVHPRPRPLHARLRSSTLNVSDRSGWLGGSRCALILDDGVRYSVVADMDEQGVKISSLDQAGSRGVA